MVRLLPRIIFVWALTLLPVAAARAFVAQSPHKAFSFNNNSTALGSSDAAAQTAARAPAAPDDGIVDYEAIAAKLIPSPQTEFDLTDCSTQEAQVLLNKTFYVVLPEVEGSSWGLETSSALVEIVSSALRGDKRTLELRPRRAGKVSVFFDNYRPNQSQPQILQSRILRLQVVAP